MKRDTKIGFDLSFLRRKVFAKRISIVIAGVYELIIQGSYSKNHYKKDINKMINTNSKLTRGRYTKKG